MTTRRLLLAFALTLAFAPAGHPSGEDEPLARFESLPSRPLRAEDFQVSVAVPRGDDLEGDMARRESVARLACCPVLRLVVDP